MSEDEWGACPTCEHRVKKENLSRHISRVHNDPELAKQFPVPLPDSVKGSAGRGRWKLGAFAVVVVLFIAGMALAFSPSGPGNPSGDTGDGPSGPAVGLAVGNIAPEITLTALDGPQFSLSQFRGQPVVVTFMAAWCGPCKIESNQIKAVYDQYTAKGVKFISVDMDPYTDTEAALRQFKSDYGGGLGHIFAMDSAEAGVALSYQATYDATWILDQSGVIVFTDREITSQDTLSSQLDRLV